MAKKKNDDALKEMEKELEEAPEEREFVASYETMIVPSGAPNSTVCILVDSYGNLRIGVAHKDNDDPDLDVAALAREFALAA